MNEYFEKAIEAFKEKDLITATVQATKAIEQDNTCYEAYLLRGQISMAFGDKKGATEDMKRALELKPELLEKLNGTFNNK